MTGRIDVHSHLLPALDDGCKTIEESIGCAQALVSAGYSHAFCTPHIWPTYKGVTRTAVPRLVERLQSTLDQAEVALKLMPGGELNLHPAVMKTPEEELVSMGMGGKYMLIDMWVAELPDFFEPAIKWLQGMGLTVILAHPERTRAIQDKPDLAEKFADMGILLQGNLQCLGDRPEAITRIIAENYLRKGRYFLLGSDSHNPGGMDVRLAGLQNAIELAGEEVVNQLTIENPRKLIPRA